MKYSEVVKLELKYQHSFNKSITHTLSKTFWTNQYPLGLQQYENYIRRVVLLKGFYMTNLNNKEQKSKPS